MLLCALPAGLFWATSASTAPTPRPEVVPSPEARPDPPEATAGAAQSSPQVATSEPDPEDDADAGVEASTTLPPGVERPTALIATAQWTPVRRAPQRDAHALGYLRSGATAQIIDGPHGRDGCVVHRGHPEGGWYRVSPRGFVCVGGAFATPYPTRDYRGATQPSLDASLPYDYAINYGRTIMYRRPPSMDDLRTYEPWRFPRPDAGATDASAAVATATPDAGSTRRARQEPVDAGQVRLSDLAGERGGPVIRRLLTGMYVALDRTVRDARVGESYWRTQSGGFVRTGRLSRLRSWPTFHGVTLDESNRLPRAWMVSNTGFSYRVAPTGRSVSYHRREARLTAFALTDDPPIEQGGQTYWRTVDGLAVNQRNVRRAVLRAPPAGVGGSERWIDVDLDEQVLVAYEGARPVFATLVSSGRRDDRGSEDRFETPEGSFRIETKHITTTMDGDTASDGPYSIEDVPWVMYFHGSYALHGAFWHGYYGWRMSHGCVNLSPADARHMFLWADPQLPPGWHGIYAADDQPGSRVELRHSRANAREEGRPREAAHAVPIASDE